MVRVIAFSRSCPGPKQHYIMIINKKRKRKKRTEQYSTVQSNYREGDVIRSVD